uniref:Ig-like domain-containing protein n=1 Tax=Callorhinchus milii TaxID=7868 RepID=A0A4W3GC00_CALMI
MLRLSLFSRRLSAALLIKYLQDIGNQTIAEISVEEGKDVKLSCTLKKISDANYLYWYRQASRNTPVYILYSIAGKDYMSPDFPDRFSSIVNKINEDFELSIVTVLIGDSAVYYCGKDRIPLLGLHFPF